MAELQKEVGKLRIIWESKKEVDEWSCALQFLVYICQLNTTNTEIHSVSVQHWGETRDWFAILTVFP